MDTYRDSKVFITGHTGIKGSWLLTMLLMLGANVVGYSNKTLFHYDALVGSSSLRENQNYKHIIGDILDENKLNDEINKYNPDIIFHLAAQPIVSDGYEYPFDTFKTNVIGTLNVLEVCRNSATRRIICATTDKVYFNKEWLRGYREDDILWGSDPYSASKVCAEQIIDSYRQSYFSENNVLVASVRAGNVIGGGEQGKDRIVTDIMKAYNDSSVLVLRCPTAKRPFQHVLDCNFGYLSLGVELLRGRSEFSGNWNFCAGSSISVEALVKEVNKHIPVRYIVQEEGMKETVTLCLDGTKSIEKLGHRPLYSIEESVEKTCLWFREYYENNKVITIGQVEDYYEKVMANKKQHIGVSERLLYG